MRRLPLALALLLVVPACKGGNGSGGGGPGCATCGPYGDVLGGLCDLIDRCPSVIGQYPIAYRSRSECVEILAFAATCRLKDIRIDNKTDFTLEQHIPKVDQAHADACVTWLKGLSCDAAGNSAVLGRKSTPCDNVVVSSDSSSSGGGPAAGEACPNNNCAHGLYCSSPKLIPSSLQTTCAVCTPLPVAGQDCRVSSSRCADGFFCQNIAMTSSAACSPVKDPGVHCDSNDQCASDFCNQGPRTCDAGGNPGDSCSAPMDCRYMNYCDGTGHCAKQVGYGQPCTSNTGCTNNNCDTNAGVCGRPNGSPCSSTGTDEGCASGFCDGTTRMCAARKPNGSACTTGGECVSNYCDTFSTRTCIAHCYSDSDCPAGQHCPFNGGSQEVCQPLAPDGAACEKPSDCLSNFCGANQHCGKKAIGDACSQSPDCYPLGYCTGGKCAQRKAPGSSCDAIDSCQDPFLCLKGQCTPMFLECRPAPVGSLCTYLRVCDPDAYCEIPSFVCKQAAHLGEKCGSIPCGKGLFCDTSKMTCTSKLAAGAACQNGDQCLEGLFCVPDPNGANGASGQTCSMGPEGRPCTSYDMPCPQGLFCQNNVCHAPGRDGAQCSSQNECADSYYCHFGGGPGTGCQPRPTLGGACWSDMPCAAGFWCDDNSRTCKTDAAVGQMCETSPGPFGIQCAPGAYCTYDLTMRMSICKQQAAAGGMCEMDQQCVSGKCWSSNNGMLECLSSSQCVMP